MKKQSYLTLSDYITNPHDSQSTSDKTLEKQYILSMFNTAFQKGQANAAIIENLCVLWYSNIRDKIKFSCCSESMHCENMLCRNERIKTCIVSLL